MRRSKRFASLVAINFGSERLWGNLCKLKLCAAEHGKESLSQALKLGELSETLVTQCDVNNYRDLVLVSLLKYLISIKIILANQC